MRIVRLYILFHNGVFRDVFASYSAAMRESHGSCCTIKQVDREEY